MNGQIRVSKLEFDFKIPDSLDVESIVRGAVSTVLVEAAHFPPRPISVEAVHVLRQSGIVTFELAAHGWTDAEEERKEIESIVRFEIEGSLSLEKAHGDAVSQRVALSSEILGSGAYSDVWAGTDMLGRDVAVKFLRPTMMPYDDLKVHARALAAQDHPSIVRVHSLEILLNPKTGQACEAIVMDRVRGESLKEHLAAQLSRHEARRIGKEMLEGVAHIHGNGMYHGDLHIENVLIDRGRVRIIDILSSDSAASLSTATRDSRRNTDVRRLRDLLLEILRCSEYGPEVAASLALQDSSLAELEEAFLRVTTEQHVGSDLSESQLAVLSAPAPDIRVRVQQAWSIGSGLPRGFLAVEAQNHSPIDVFLGNFAVLCRDGTRLVTSSDPLTGDHPTRRRLEPGNSFTVHFSPSRLLGARPFKGFQCAVVNDAVGRRYLSEEDEFLTVLKSLISTHGVTGEDDDHAAD